MHYSVTRLLMLLGLTGSLCSADPRTAFTLFETVRDQPGVAFAPAALDDVLSLLYFGSAGETETAFQSRLFPTLSRTDVKKQVAQRNRTTPGYESLGGLWMDTRLSLVEEFKQAARRDWGWPVARAPLQTDPADSATIINAWFSSETNGHTTHIVSPADIPPGSGFIGIIVATFVSPWKQEYFKMGDTIAEDFHFSAKSKARVSTMKSLTTFSYSENEQLQLLRLDYKHKGVALLLLLPKDASRLGESLATFTAETFAKSVADLRSTKVQVWLPKVRSVSHIDWRKPLGQLGLATAFTPEADFSRISGDKQVPLSLARLVQDVHIQWDEAGTDARSRIIHLSWLGIVEEPPPPPVRFIANHPFAYLIFNTTNLDIYFMGVVSEPSQVLTL